MTTNVDIANRALLLAGTRSQITAIPDGSKEADAVGLLYQPFRDALLFKDDYEFAVKAAAAASGGTPIPGVWNYSYALPNDAVRTLQLVPAVVVPLDPRPVAWQRVAQTVQTNELISQIIYIFQADENAWNAIFTNVMIHYLGAGLAYALKASSTISKQLLDESLQFAGLATTRRDT